MNLACRLEALIFASDEPINIQKLREMLDDKTSSSDIRQALAELESRYNNRGIRLQQIAGGWQFRTAPECAAIVQRLWQTRPARLSRSMLETLAIIAYRQPTTRAEIEALRGVRISSGMLASLQERGWVRVLGRKEVPGRPHLYGTGRQFLIDFGLDSLSDLPDSSQLMDDEELIAAAQQQTPDTDPAAEERETEHGSASTREEDQGTRTAGPEPDKTSGFGTDNQS